MIYSSEESTQGLVGCCATHINGFVKHSLIWWGGEAFTKRSKSHLAHFILKKKNANVEMVRWMLGFTCWIHFCKQLFIPVRGGWPFIVCVNIKVSESQLPGGDIHNGCPRLVACVTPSRVPLRQSNSVL